MFVRINHAAICSDHYALNGRFRAATGAPAGSIISASKSTMSRTLIAPAGTPEAIVQRLAQEVRRVLALEPMRRFLDDHGMEAGDLGPEALKAYIAPEHARYGRMVRETGVRVE